MSKKLLLILVLSFLLVATLVGCRGVSPSAPTQLTMLSIAEGSVFIMEPGADNWVEAQAGMNLESGDTIKAGDNSRAVITFFEGSTIELEAGTEINVAELTVVADTGSTTVRLKQELGKTVSRVEKLADPASRYEIETPAAVAVVRGTRMGVTVFQDGLTLVDNWEGSVVTRVRGKDYTVPVLYRISIRPGELPSSPYAIISQVQPSQLPPPKPSEKPSPPLLERPYRPAIALTKEANPTEAQEGDEITYTYEVTNTGNTALSNVSVDDDKAGEADYQNGDTNGNNRLDANETWIFTAAYTVSDEDDSPLVNTATASGTGVLTPGAPAASARRVTAEASASVTILRPAIALTKEANPTEVHEGDEVTYTYEVTNTGNTPLSDVSVNDDKAGDATYQSGDTNDNNKLDVNETWIFTAAYTVSDEDDNPLVNTATASARTVTAQASASVSILRPAIALTKEADHTEAQEGDEITYTYELANPGNTPLSDVSVNDDKAGDATYQSGDNNDNNKLDVNETWIFTASYTVTEGDTNPLINVATASGIDDLGETVTDQASASVTILVCGIRIELTWDAETDLDSHFIRPGGEMWDMLDDCHWRNENPDWGLPGVVEDNPLLSGDDKDGYGPEYIYLWEPYEEGVYQYKVNCWDDYGHGPSTATVIIWINNVKVAEYSREVSYDEVWDCASIEWPSGVVTPASGGESYSPPELAK